MREIKFRGKREDTKEWVYGYVYKVESKGLWFIDNGKTISHQVIPETVGQFTGLLDKNGTEIYEGDVVLCDRNINDAFDKTTFLIGIDEYFRYQGVSKLGNEISVEEFEYAEVICNIRDNKELLEQLETKSERCEQSHEFGAKMIVQNKRQKYYEYLSKGRKALLF